MDISTGRVLEKVSPCVSLGYQTAAIFLPDIWDQNVRMYFIKQIHVMFKNKKNTIGILQCVVPVCEVGRLHLYKDPGL